MNISRRSLLYFNITILWLLRVASSAPYPAGRCCVWCRQCAEPSPGRWRQKRGEYRRLSEGQRPLWILFTRRKRRARKNSQIKFGALLTGALIHSLGSKCSR